MSGTNNLGIPQMDDSTAGKAAFLNDMLALIDQSITAALAVDATNNAAVSSAALRNYLKLTATNAPAGGSTITLGPAVKVIVLANDAASSGDVTYTCGTASIVVSKGNIALAYMDGTANGLETVSANSAGNVGPQGPKGDVGPAGPQGPVGPQGPAGSGGGGGGGGSPFPGLTPPTTAVFSQTKASPDGATTALDDADVGLIFALNNPAGADRNSSIAKPIPTPANAWSARCHFKALQSIRQYSFVGMCCYVDGQATSEAIGRHSTGDIYVIRYRQAGTGYQDNSLDWFPQLTPFEHFRIDFDGNDTVTYFISMNGKSWVQVMQHSAATYLGGKPDHVGFIVANNEGQTPIEITVPFYTDNVT